MDEAQANLIAEQLGRLTDRIDARLKALEVAQASHETLEAERTSNQHDQTKELKEIVQDHENRLREVQKESARSQTMLNLSAGGAMITSIAAALRAFLGP